jgi:DNA-binding NarL/FixJ family response regulator
VCRAVQDSSDTATVVIVEDHVALRRGLELLLRDTDCRVIGTADDAETAQTLVERRRPDVAIVDINLPGQSGIELTRALLGENPDLGVLLYTGIDDQDTLSAALDCGARGFALKTAPPSELGEAVSVVGAGGTYMDPRLRALILSSQTTEAVRVLSPREREILDGVARGLSGDQLGEELAISPETVRTHIRNAMEKLEAHTRAHAVVIALRQGEIEF